MLLVFYMVYLIAFLSPLFFALSVLIESFLSLDVFKKPATMCFYVSVTNALFVPLVLFFGLPTLPHTGCWFIYFLIAVLDIAYLYPFYMALKETDTSIVSSLFTIGKVFIPIMAFVILKDVLSLQQYIGFAIVIFASLILTIKRGISFSVNKAFYLMFLSSFLLASRIILAKLALTIDTTWVNTMFYPNLISGGLIFAFLLFRKLRPDIRTHFIDYKKNIKLFVLIEFITFLAVLSSVYALSKLSPTISSAIEATEPLFLLVIAMLLRPIYHFQCQELDVSWTKKLICFILIIIGVVFVS